MPVFIKILLPFVTKALIELSLIIWILISEFKFAALKIGVEMFFKKFSVCESLIKLIAKLCFMVIINNNREILVILASVLLSLFNIFKLC